MKRRKRTHNRRIPLNKYKKKHRLDFCIRSWLFSYAQKNLWRVPEWYDIDDLIQDGYMCVAKCEQRYTHVTSRPHFMSLIKVTFSNHIHDLSTKKTGLAELHIDDTVALDYNSWAGVQQEEQTLAALISSAPRELRDLFKLLADDSKMLCRQRPQKNAQGRPETNNEFFCRVLKLPQDLDLVSMLKTHLELSY